MRRREFIGLIGTSAFGLPRPGYSQTKTDLPLVGFLMTNKSETDIAKQRVAALRKGLQEAGFVEGTNYSLAVRFAEGDLGRLPSLAKELGDLKPTVLVVASFPMRVHKILPEIPMVFSGFAAASVAISP